MIDNFKKQNLLTEKNSKLENPKTPMFYTSSKIHKGYSISIDGCKTSI